MSSLYFIELTALIRPFYGFSVLTCLICSGQEKRELFQVTRILEGTSLQYSILECQGCGFQWASGPCDDALLSKIFDEKFHASSQQIGPESWGDTKDLESYPIVSNAMRRAEKLHAKKLQGPLLDVGSGRGYFVRAATQYFEAEGVELNSQNERFARSLGIRQSFGDFFSLALKSGHYRTVTLWDVLAGFSDPARVLSRVHECLAPGGHVVFTVPMADSAVAKLLGPRWPLMIPPINLSFFTKPSLTILLEKCGFELESGESETKRVNLDFLLKKASESFLGLGKKHILKDRFKNYSLPINLHDILTVVARKK